MNFDLDLWKNIAMFAIISFIPIFGWICFFQAQNREKNKYIIITFIAGMLSIIPIKLYEKYWDVSIWYLEHLNLFEYINAIADSATLTKFTSFLLVSMIVAGFMFLFSAIIMFIPEVFSKDNTLTCYRKKTTKILESPFLFVSVGALFGLTAVVLALFLPERVWFFVIVGMLEEFGKYLMLRFADEEKIGSISDAISFSIIIALGFAFIENVVYLFRFWETADQGVMNFFAFFLLRSTISTIAHVCFSSIIGYFYGIAHFSEQIYLEESHKNKHPILRKIHQIFHLKVSPLFHEEKLFEGLLLAMLVHAIFNSLLEFEFVILIIPFLIGIFILILNLLHRRDNHIRRKNIIYHIS